MVIGIVGIILLSRLHVLKRAGQERLPMRKIREVLRLHSLGLSQRQIAASCAVGQATVSEYLKAAEVAGLKWPDIAEWGEDRLTETVASSREKPVHRNQPPEPDFADIRHELQTNKHVTLQLLWEEYREKNPEGYRYSRFCDLYRGWLRRQETVIGITRNSDRHQIGMSDRHRRNTQTCPSGATSQSKTWDRSTKPVLRRR